jgi:hypothetical protein
MQVILENILDTLCKATGRDIFVYLPHKEEERIPYLIKEIEITLKRVKQTREDKLKAYLN